MTKEELKAYQQEMIANRQAELEQAQKEKDAYLESEEYQRDQWEAQQDRWEQKAKKEGWHYNRQPFVSALQRQQMEEREKKEKIAYLEEQLKALKGE